LVIRFSKIDTPKSVAAFRTPNSDNFAVVNHKNRVHPVVQFWPSDVATITGRLAFLQKKKTR
jgi:hypothetical protein